MLREQVWEWRPLTDDLLRYATCDVRYLHALEDAINVRLPSLVVNKVRLRHRLSCQG